MDNDEIKEVVIGEYIGNINSYKGGRYRGLWTITNKNIKYIEKNGFEFNISQKNILEVQKDINKYCVIIKYRSNYSVKIVEKIRVFISKKHYDEFIDAFIHIGGKFELKEVNNKDIYFIVFIVCMFILLSSVLSLFLFI